MKKESLKGIYIIILYLYSFYMNAIYYFVYPAMNISGTAR